MNTRDLVDDPAVRRAVPARDATELFLERIGRRQEHTRSMMAVCADQAREDALRVDAARAEGCPLPLDGMPIVIKDNIDVAGVRSTSGSAFFVDHRADRDSAVVGRLRSNGAVILGKAQTTEFMFALAPHPMFPAARNVWDVDRIPGPSSNGVAVALADDLAIGGVGTDTGGSVRLPSSFCGLTGLRPTFGAISNVGVFPLSRTFDTVGPMARSAEDVAALFQVLVGYDRRDTRSVEYRPWGKRPVDVSQLRIGVPRQFFFDECDAPVKDAVLQAVDHFAAQSAQIIEIDLPLAQAAHRVFRLLSPAEALSIHKDRLEREPERFGRDVRDRLRSAQALSAVDAARLIDDAYAWRRQVANVFGDEVDVIMTPTTQTSPPLLTEARLENLAGVTRLTYPWSVAHVPAVSIPCGFTDQGLPIGLQIAGQPGADEFLLDVARHYQAETSWHHARPDAQPEGDQK